MEHYILLEILLSSRKIIYISMHILKLLELDWVILTESIMRYLKLNSHMGLVCMGKMYF
nr:MAG TPA: hypothetical protein [Bacteriophage sp.]